MTVRTSEVVFGTNENDNKAACEAELTTILSELGHAETHFTYLFLKDWLKRIYELNTNTNADTNTNTNTKTNDPNHKHEEKGTFAVRQNIMRLYIKLAETHWHIQNQPTECFVKEMLPDTDHNLMDETIAKRVINLINTMRQRHLHPEKPVSHLHPGTTISSHTGAADHHVHSAATGHHVHPATTDHVHTENHAHTVHRSKSTPVMTVR